MCRADGTKKFDSLADAVARSRVLKSKPFCTRVKPRVANLGYKIIEPTEDRVVHRIDLLIARPDCIPPSCLGRSEG